ncbi:DUF222 domain-containing protein [Pseudonocardia sp. C8]|nr:DUF222 domain-containing protein [Pseudonocardia sp. C8]MBC3190239.1 DUF222 domain-containing protein [Pseudonocardia sp. C8]
MPSDRLAAAHRLLTEAIAALDEAAGPAASDDELLSVLTLCEGAVRRLDRVTVATIGALERRGTFAERGYRTPAAGLADLLNWERSEARRRTRAAEQVHPRTGLDGGVQPPRLPATAQRFAEGRIGLRHVDVIASVLDSHAARRVSPERLAAAEAEIAEHACVYNPSELHTWARRLIEALDQDGPAPDDAPPPSVNTLTVVAHRDGSGGRISGRFDDAARFDAIAAAVDALAAPRDHLDDRRPEQRQADALADLCAQVPRARGAARDRWAAPDAERADRAGGPAAPGDGRAAGLRRPAHPGEPADAGLRRRRRADRDERRRPTPRHRPGHTHHPGRATPRGHRPRPRLRPPRL